LHRYFLAAAIALTGIDPGAVGKSDQQVGSGSSFFQGAGSQEGQSGRSTVRVGSWYVKKTPSYLLDTSMSIG